jgi:DNA-binding response OmpR family regulator
MQVSRDKADMKALTNIPPRALIADDQPEVLQALRLLLKGEGIQTFSVTSPAAVIDALKSQHFDIVLMDLNYTRDTTSGREGLDLLTRIAALDSTLPVVVMTGWGSVDLAVEAMRMGVQDFVQKPWENDRLLNTLRTHIAKGRIVRKGLRLDAEMKVLNGEIIDAPDLHVMFQRVAAHLLRALRTSRVAIFTRAPLDRAFWATVQAGGTEEILGKLKFEPDNRLLNHLDGICDPWSKELAEPDMAKLRQVGCSRLLPLRLKGDLFGFVSIGAKLSGEAFDEEEIRFLKLVADRIGFGIENLRLRGQEREWAEAREIQRGLLPKQVPQIPRHEIFGGWQPASAVGGDYYDALKFTDTKVALCIADVSGKGMPAALLMSNLQAAVKAFASEAVPPKDLCAKVNRVICSNIAPNRFITFFYCLYDTARMRLSYARAGHDAPILMRKDGSHLRLREGGAVLGVFPDWNYEQDEVAFSPGDRLLLFTDGVTEITNSSGEEFGERRLLEFLTQNRHLGARKLQTQIMQTIAEFSSGEFHDDATILVMSTE